jgi:oligopeptide/dipeptide ABC transporter ATP-binding protein
MPMALYLFLEVAQMINPIYQARGVKKLFPITGGILRRTIGHVRALDRVDLDIYRGETVAVIGESGCGKTTLGRMLALLAKPTEGQLSFDFGNGLEDVTNIDAKNEMNYRKRVQMIFQDPYTSFNPRQRIGAAIEEVLLVQGVSDEDERKSRILEAMEMVNIRPEYLLRYPHEFSGGQRQRLSIARSLAGKPELIIADEIVSALDVSIQAQIVNLLKNIQKERGLSFMFITHDVAVARFMGHRVAVMYLGSVVEIIPSDSLPGKAEHPYTIALLSAVPDMVSQEKKLHKVTLQGEVPSPIDAPPGCTFSTRCPFAMEICRNEKPILKIAKSGSAGHQVACHLETPPNR